VDEIVDMKRHDLPVVEISAMTGFDRETIYNYSAEQVTPRCGLPQPRVN